MFWVIIDENEKKKIRFFIIFSVEVELIRDCLVWGVF